MMNRIPHSLSALLLALTFVASTATAQTELPGTFSIGSAGAAVAPMIPGNSVSHITMGDDGILWIGSGKGLARTTNSGGTWESFRSDPAFARDGIFAISLRGDTIWAATGYDKEVDGGSVQTGTGYAISTDNGSTWTPIPQVLDARGDSILPYGINDSLWFLPIVVPEQNVTFDVSFGPSAVWVASWASGLRRSTDLGATWERIVLPTDSRNRISPQDTLWTYLPSDTARVDRIFERFDPRANNNFLAFSVLAVDDDTIWCGTAGGVNLSTDGGRSWSRFTHTNQASPILGNWVIAVERQVFHDAGAGDTVRRVWTTNWQASGPDEQFGVSYTDDNGRRWTNLLQGVRAYDFAFRDSIVYIATNQGVFRTADGGGSFIQVSDIIDDDGRTPVTSGSVYSVGAVGDTVYVGTGDGLARTLDNDAHPFGSTWKVFRSYQAVGSSGQTYAYPNPFSPLTEPVRIHYATPAGGGGDTQVRIELFDFGMNRVRTLINRAPRPPGAELDEIWDGKDDHGSTVANGVYFFRIDVGTGDPMFGKIVVMQ